MLQYTYENREEGGSKTYRRLSINLLNSSTANIHANDGYQRPVDTSSTNYDADRTGDGNVSL